jgi:hypothetical protein
MADTTTRDCKSCGHEFDSIFSIDKGYCDECKVVCRCDDPHCDKTGIEGEVGGHIESCTCADCHRYMGKISPWLSNVPMGYNCDGEYTNS